MHQFFGQGMLHRLGSKFRATNPTRIILSNASFTFRALGAQGLVVKLSESGVQNRLFTLTTLETVFVPAAL